MENRLLRLLNETFNVDGGQLTLDSRLSDLDGWDSLAHMEFIVSLETEYKIELTGDEIANIRTIGDVRTLVNRKSN